MWRTCKKTAFTKTLGEIVTSSHASSRLRRLVTVSSESRSAARRSACSAPFPNSPSTEPRARARRIPPPSLSQPMRNGVVNRYRPVVGHVTVFPLPLTPCLQVLRRWRRSQSFTMSLGKVTGRRAGAERPKVLGSGSAGPAARGDLNSPVRLLHWSSLCTGQVEVEVEADRSPTRIRGVPHRLCSSIDSVTSIPPRQYSGPGQLPL